MVRRPDAFYLAGRSAEILKVKSFQDAEAVVVAHLPGSGRNRDRLGSLLVELPGGVQFRIGSGFSDAQREYPPPIGEVVTFKHYGFYPSGIPKFPSFLRVRKDRAL
jgi:DNA ligase-1